LRDAECGPGKRGAAGEIGFLKLESSGTEGRARLSYGNLASGGTDCRDWGLLGTKGD